jgi:ABC-2 type transport system ATP-binding protein
VPSPVRARGGGDDTDHQARWDAVALGGDGDLAGQDGQARSVLHEVEAQGARGAGACDHAQCQDLRRPDLDVHQRGRDAGGAVGQGLDQGARRSDTGDDAHQAAPGDDRHARGDAGIRAEIDIHITPSQPGRACHDPGSVQGQTRRHCPGALAGQGLVVGQARAQPGDLGQECGLVVVVHGGSCPTCAECGGAGQDAGGATGEPVTKARADDECGDNGQRRKRPDQAEHATRPYDRSPAWPSSPVAQPPLAVTVPAMQDAVVAQGLTKVFRIFDRRPGIAGALRDLVDRRWRSMTAVDAVDLRVGAGEIVGYLGPNGAGKSTTIKMLTGILAPSSGSLSVVGLDPHRQRSAFARRVGAVFGQRSQLWWDLAVGESFELLRHLYEVPAADHAARLKRYDEVLGLGEFLRTPVRKLSLGQRMKADLAASLLHGPEVLFLDEPTVGVDVVTKSRLRDFLADLNRTQGTTILLTTHDMQDIEALCRRVVVIDHGKIVHDGGLDELRARYGGGRRLTLTTARPVELAQLDLPRTGIVWTQTSPMALVAELPRDADTAAVLQRCLAACPVADVGMADASIDDVVKSLYAARGA